MWIKIELLENETDFGPEQVDVCFFIRQIHAIHGQFAFINRSQLVDCADQGAMPMVRP